MPRITVFALGLGSALDAGFLAGALAMALVGGGTLLAGACCGDAGPVDITATNAGSVLFRGGGLTVPLSALLFALKGLHRPLLPLQQNGFR